MQALILAGGKGTRLGALTLGRPKPLLDVGGKPFIIFLIRTLKRFGFTDILLLVGPFSTSMKSNWAMVSTLACALDGFQRIHPLTLPAPSSMQHLIWSDGFCY